MSSLLQLLKERKLFQWNLAYLAGSWPWLAYVSNESGRHEVYVRAFPDPGSRWQASTGGGTEPYN